MTLLWSARWTLVEPLGLLISRQELFDATAACSWILRPVQKKGLCNVGNPSADISQNDRFCLMLDGPGIVNPLLSTSECL
jgi:hypothetical protein